MHRRRANGPMWVSHNKVLVGNGGLGIKKAHARNPNFDSDETKLLIQLWGDPQVQRTLITIHKKHPVIAKIAERMRGYGYNRSTEEVNTRIKNLKCLYNRIKKDLEAGLLNEPSWKHFQAMDEILSRPVFGNSDKVSSNGSKIVISSLSSSTSSSPPLGLHLCQVKDEDTSGDDADDDMDTMMEYDGNELRPEDLLHVVEDEDDVEEDDDIIECHQVKEEPVDITDDLGDEDIEEVLEEFIETKPELTQTEMDDNDLKPPPAKVIKTETKLKLTTLTTPISIQTTSANDTKLSITSVVSNGNSPTDAPANKISLVPTKLLLKTQTLKATPTLVYTSQGTVASTVTTPAASQKSPAMPMKVLFVNALKNPTTPAQNQAQLTASLNKSLTQLHQQQQQSKHKILTTSSKQHIVQQLSNAKTTPSVQTTTLLQNCRKLLNIMPNGSPTTNGEAAAAKTDVDNPSASIPARIVHYAPKNPSKFRWFFQTSRIVLMNFPFSFPHNCLKYCGSREQASEY